MAGDAPPATASGPGIPYAEWPVELGDPRWHRPDHDHGSDDRSRQAIVARYRRQRPECHGPVAALAQWTRARDAERTTYATRICSFQVHCHRARATRKCHHCIQFDPQHLGYYCDSCFVARHPSYRMTHAWSALEDDVDPAQSWTTHLVHHNLEQDAQELALLLTQTQSFLKTHTSQLPSPSRVGTRSRPLAPNAIDLLTKLRLPNGSFDFDRVHASVTHIATTLKTLVEQIHTELATKPLTRDEALVKIQTMWRIRRARKQMRTLLESVYQSFTDPTTGQTYYYNNRTKETKWTKPRGLENVELSPQSQNQEPNDQRVNKFQGIVNVHERETLAVKCIQGMVRTHTARRHLRRLISSVYEKIWDPTSQRFYYYNTKTDEVKWTRPKWVSDNELLTPRTRDAHEEQAALALKQQKLVNLREHMTTDEAASMVQRAFRKRRGFRHLLSLCRGVYERIYDADADMYYYHNTRTHEVTWDKPLLLRHANADVYSPRSRAKHLETLMRPKRHVEWTEETAAVRLQGLYRARVARRELAARLADAYKKVWDSTSERFYYANLTTGTVSWDLPAILQRRSDVEVEEVR